MTLADLLTADGVSDPGFAGLELQGVSADSRTLKRSEEHTSELQSL